MERVVVLNADNCYLNTTHWKRAMILVLKGKAEVVKYSEKCIKNFEGTFTFTIPKVIQLSKLVCYVFRNKARFRKHNVFLRDEYLCQYCGKKLEDPTLDHVKPKSCGGKRSFENCVTSCFRCNQKKRNRTPEQSRMHPRRDPRTPTVMELMMKKSKFYSIRERLEELGIV